MARRKIEYCSFCSKREDEVERLIAAPPPTNICNECILLCYDMLKEPKPADHREALSLDDLLGKH